MMNCSSIQELKLTVSNIVNTQNAARRYSMVRKIWTWIKVYYTSLAVIALMALTAIVCFGPDLCRKMLGIECKTSIQKCLDNVPEFDGMKKREYKRK